MAAPVLVSDLRAWLHRKPRFLDTLSASFDLVLHGKSARLGEHGLILEAQYLHWGVRLLSSLVMFSDAQAGLGPGPVSKVETLPWLRQALVLSAALLPKRGELPLAELSLYTRLCITYMAGGTLDCLPGSPLVPALQEEPMDALRAAEGIAVLMAQVPSDVDTEMLRETGTALHTALAIAVRRFPADVFRQAGAINAVVWLAESAIKIFLRQAAERESQQTKASLHALASLAGQAWEAMSDSLLPGGQHAVQSTPAVSPTMLR